MVSGIGPALRAYFSHSERLGRSVWNRDSIEVRLPGRNPAIQTGRKVEGETKKKRKTVSTNKNSLRIRIRISLECKLLRYFCAEKLLGTGKRDVTYLCE